MRVEAMEIPRVYSAYGIAASGDWTDRASLSRVVGELWPEGSMLFAGPKEQRDHAFAAHGGSDYALYDDEAYETSDACDQAFLADLKREHGLLVLFLGENPAGRIRQLAEKADEIGLDVAVVQAPPASEPSVLPSYAAKIQRAQDVLTKLEEQAGRGDGAVARRRVYLDLALQHMADLRKYRSELEEQTNREWEWLDRHPLRLDFCVREHTTLCRIMTLTAILHALDHFQTWVTTSDLSQAKAVIA